MAKLLQRLPEDWIVYHEPGVGGLQPDFVIFAPAHGVIVMEVKDWKFSSVESLDPEFVELRPGRGLERVRVKHPLRQARGYVFALINACLTDRFGRELIQASGPYEGHLRFPVGKVLVFTGIASAQVEGSRHEAAWSTVFPREHTLLSDDLAGWTTLEGGALAEKFRPFFRPFSLSVPFSAHEIDVLRWVLFPESRLEVILRGARSDHDEAVAVLDARQERHARSLGGGHRLLSGVAGSGKTVLLMARARHLANRRPGQRTLLLCYNKLLAEWLRARMEDCPSVTVRHFDGWTRDLRLTRRDTDTDDAAFGERVLAGLRKLGDRARVWDAVLIDEAQDFEPSWFQCVLAVMRDPVDGDLVIVGDGSQRLYKRRRVSWKALGIRASGRTISARYDLDKNYRNTPGIAALAQGFSDDEADEDGIASRRVGPNTCRRTNHSRPVLVEAGNHSRQVDAAVEIVRRWIHGERGGGAVKPIAPEDIAIFYPRLGRGGRLLDELVARLDALAPTRWLSDRGNAKSHLGIHEKAIKVQTVHSAKGLQYKSVVILWTDQLPTTEDAMEEERRLLYVAITRAENDLVLIGNGAGGFDPKFRETCAVRRYPFAGNPPDDAAVALTR
jgi:hypothetical protein